MERDYAALRAEFKKIEESEKLAKKREYEATQMAQSINFDATNAKLQLEEQLAAINKVLFGYSSFLPFLI